MKRKYVIKWVVNKYRRDKRTGVLSPVPRSEYAQRLFEKGAGWKNEQKRD
jgi:hypothetical protein